MFDEPIDLTPQRVGDLLREHWGFAAAHTRYAAVGFGSYHWVAERSDGDATWFVTADRLDTGILDLLSRTATVTHELASSGLEFVVAGLPDRGGRLVVDVGRGWAMQVFPYLYGMSTEFGEWREPADRRQIAGVLARLHQSEPPPAVPRWESAIPKRDALAEAFANLDQPWRSGPYAERARAALAERRSAIERRLAHYDELAIAVDATVADWVVSHGEPHGGNVIRADGNMHLIDWDTVRLAPAERDLVNAFGDGHADLRDDDAISAYVQLRGLGRLNEDAVELFRLWWGLAEICAYTLHFRSPHGDGEDDRVSWKGLVYYLPD